jgi:hypothetical protein
MIHPNVLFVFHGVVTRVMCTPPSTIDDDDDDDDALGGPRDDERWRRWVCATSFCGRGEHTTWRSFSVVSATYSHSRARSKLR